MWRVAAPADDWTFILEFKDFEVQDTCQSGGTKLQIYKSWDESQWWREYCGTTELPPGKQIQINKPKFMIIFITDDSDVAHRGFEMEFYPEAAFEILTEPMGEIKSLDYNTGLTEPLTQIWLITAEPTYKPRLTVLDGELGTNELTFVDTYSGRQIDHNQRITHWIKIQRNAQSNSKNTDMLVYLKSHETNYDTKKFKFHASWDSAPGGADVCGQVITADHGSIQSPGYPAQYSDDLDCEWMVNTPVDFGDDEHFVISFKDFAVEYGKNCKHDSLQIYHTNKSNDNRLANLCGDQKPKDIHVPNGKSFILVFKTDFAGTDKGFDLTWNKNCGSNEIAEKDTSGFIATGNYPEPYHSNSHCYWTIRTPDGTADEKIFLHFTHFDTYVDPQDPRNCDKGHYVQVYEGSVPDQSNDKKYCGTMAPPLYVSRGNQIKVLFDAEIDDQDHQRSGFYATYNLGSETCGGTLWGLEGEFMPPGYSAGKYLPNLDCEWTVHGSPGNTVFMSWTKAEIEQSEGCAKDRLEVHENDRNGLMWAKCCDPYGYQMGSERFWVNFVSDEDIELRGWVINYQQLFGGIFSYEKLQRGQISSPLWPHLYPSYQNVWYIMNGKEGHHIVHYNIIEFDVPCVDEVILADGSSNGEEIDRLCGSFDDLSRWSIAGETKSESLSVNFKSDSHIWGHGFLIDWWFVVSDDWDPNENEPDPIEPGICGNDLVMAGLNHNLITSPGYPNSYPTEADCVWFLGLR